MNTKGHERPTADVPLTFHANSAPPGAAIYPQPTGNPQNNAQARLEALEQHVNAISMRVEQLYTLIETLRERTPASLRVDLDGVATALDALSAANRREFSRLWKRIGADHGGGGATGEQLQRGDDSFEAMLALQAATK